VPGWGPEYCQQRHVEAAALQIAYVLDEQKVELWAHWALLLVNATQAFMACVWLYVLSAVQS
jgi:hypothetical protein